MVDSCATIHTLQHTTAATRHSTRGNTPNATESTTESTQHRMFLPLFSPSLLLLFSSPVLPSSLLFSPSLLPLPLLFSCSSHLPASMAVSLTVSEGSGKPLSKTTERRRPTPSCEIGFKQERRRRARRRRGVEGKKEDGGGRWSCKRRRRRREKSGYRREDEGGRRGVAFHIIIYRQDALIEWAYYLPQESISSWSQHCGHITSHFLLSEMSDSHHPIYIYMGLLKVFNYFFN